MLLPKHLFNEDYFGLSISRSSIKAVSLDKSGLIKSSSQTTLEPGVFDQVAISKEKLIEALRQVVTQGNFNSFYTAVCLPEFFSFSRTYQIPVIPLPEITEALSWQMESIFPIPKDELYYDWKLISRNQQGLNLLIVAMPKKTLDSLIEIFELVGVKPITFEPAASSLARTVKLESNQHYILIDINPYGASSTLIENNISTLTITNQFDNPTQQEAIQTALTQVSQSIQSLISFFSNKHDSHTPTFGLLLTGDSASQELADWLSTYINQPVNVLDIPGVTPSLHQAYAAAKTTISPPDTGLSLNLLPDSVSQLYASMRKKQSTQLHFRIIGLIAFVGLVLSLINWIAVQNRYQVTNNELSLLQEQVVTGGYDLSEVTYLNKASKNIVTLFPKKRIPIAGYQQVVDNIPSGISITQIDLDSLKATLVVSGRAQDRQALIDYRRLLNESDYLTQVSLPLDTIEKPQDIDFTLTATLVGFTPQAAGGSGGLKIQI